MHDFVGQDVAPDSVLDPLFLALGVGALHLVFHVVEQCLQTGAEQFLHQVTRQFEPLVGVVVLVIRLSRPDMQFQYLARHAPQEERLLVPHLQAGREVWQQGIVEDVVDALAPVLLGLPSCKASLQVFQSFLGGVDLLFAVDALDVGQDKVSSRLLTGDGAHDVVSGFHSQRHHQHHQRNTSRGDGDGNVQDTILLFLDHGQRAEPLTLREYLGELGLPLVPCLALDHHPVGCQVFEAYKHPFGAVDNEVAARVFRVLLFQSQDSGVLIVREAPVGPQPLFVLGVQVFTLPLQVATH